MPSPTNSHLDTPNFISPNIITTMLDINPRAQDENHTNYRHRFNGGVNFRLETMEEDSSVCSPPLWRSLSPPDSPVRFPNSRALSPASRAQAIARGQREMMEMVENMPETSYELSLKDIVEQRREVIKDVSLDETQSMEDGEARLISGGQSQQLRKKKKGSVKRQEGNKTGRIIVNNNNKGLLINMFFPFSFGSKKKNTSIRTSSYSSVKSSPKTDLLDKSSDRRDWWNKFTDSEGRESLGVTSSSSSGGESTGRSGSSGSSTTESLGNNNSCSNLCGDICNAGERMIALTDVGHYFASERKNHKVLLKLDEYDWL